MGLILIDGRGKWGSAGVSKENRVLVEAVSASKEHHINHHNGKAYNMVFSQSPTAAGDCIAFIKNESDENLVVEGVTLGVINATADDSIYFKVDSEGTRNSATDVTPVNVNAGSGRTAEGIFEKGADLDGGAATLTGGSEFDRFVLAGITDLTSQHMNFVQDLIVPKNRSFSIWVDGSATGTYYLTIHFNYHPKED